MPTYEYRCAQCGETFEVYQSFTDKPLKRHKGCGGDLKKVFHARGIVFKGSGFYATDVRGPAASGNGSGDGDTKKSGESPAKVDKSEKAKPADKKPAPASKD